MKRRKVTRHGILCVSMLVMLNACEGAVPPHEDPYTPKPGTFDKNYPEGSILGSDGLDLTSLFGSRQRSSQGGGSGIGVNSFLWRATLDTVSFMPLVSADPFGGVIITDWYSPPETPNKRFKVNVYILGRELRPDGIRVMAFHQTRVDGQWVDAPLRPETATRLEDRVLTRARELHAATRAAGN